MIVIVGRPLTFKSGIIHFRRRAEIFHPQIIEKLIPGKVRRVFIKDGSGPVLRRYRLPVYLNGGLHAGAQRLELLGHLVCDRDYLIKEALVFRITSPGIGTSIAARAVKPIL